eukprot:CAMPEP_0203908842 /NCGR_PEP_ID=MMETSP0359-20131031/50199_1 /ASSEMBLY_ACC=CAM_ASM_000338 /TAXON_ID=268821 /ORGANISM="Scrippsiella Hangoei, Strain SHTV-5" /LENGTH=152 /DNA_ID=CAMNT_0050833931 /DNA_START=224 /DNA_END=678 /DNA_ORIENTATION=+
MGSVVLLARTVVACVTTGLSVVLGSEVLLTRTVVACVTTSLSVVLGWVVLLARAVVACVTTCLLIVLGSLVVLVQAVAASAEELADTTPVGDDSVCQAAGTTNRHPACEREADQLPRRHQYEGQNQDSRDDTLQKESSRHVEGGVGIWHRWE